jgi:hypothetical protein
MKTTTDRLALHQLPAFEQGYFTAAFFTSDDEAPGGMDYRDTGNADELFERLHPDNYDKQATQLWKFYKDNQDDIDAIGDDFGAGADLWYTRNRHGVGYWDNYNEGYDDDVAKRLTDAAHALGEVYCNIDAEGVFIE